MGVVRCSFIMVGIFVHLVHGRRYNLFLLHSGDGHGRFLHFYLYMVHLLYILLETVFAFFFLLFAGRSFYLFYLFYVHEWYIYVELLGVHSGTVLLWYRGMNSVLYIFCWWVHGLFAFVCTSGL